MMGHSETLHSTSSMSRRDSALPAKKKDKNSLSPDCRREMRSIFHHCFPRNRTSPKWIVTLGIAWIVTCLSYWYFSKSSTVLIVVQPTQIPTDVPAQVTHPPIVTSPDGKVTSLLQPENTTVVPNVVHYVWFGGEGAPLRFHHMLSIISAHKFVQADEILFHCDFVPVGQWWKHVKKNVKELQVIHRNPPEEIFGNQIILPEHKSDVARMEILMEHGGIYLDLDVIALKSFTPLRKYNFTMGLEYHAEPGRLNNGVIISRKDSQFLKIWYESYSDFTKREWDYHDSVVPYLLQFDHPELIHVEENTINYPGGQQLGLIYDELYDWSRNYAMHLWFRLHGIEHNPREIQGMNTTFGEVARYVYFGNKTLIRH